MNSTPLNRPCPLCRSSNGKPFYKGKRGYYRCPLCYLVFVLPNQFLSRQEEKAEYDLHQNRLNDPGYQRFLSRLFGPMLRRLPPNCCGLDFGSGPVPALAAMFEKAGHTMQVYDSFYSPDIRALQQKYDFVVASEVVEHLHRPGRELDRLWTCLRPGGYLGIMTKRVLGRAAFSRWHYKRDLTHVCFYSIKTFQWLAGRWGAALAVPALDVVILTKPRNGRS